MATNDIGRLIHAHLFDVEKYLQEVESTNLSTLQDWRGTLQDWRVLTQSSYERLLHSRIVVVQEIRDQLYSGELKSS